ncbi:MAG: CDP-diacylglycerol--glycerol-3-phosphate 3-phosphatidyltransferase [Coprobacillaceae bacterium]
MNLPNKLTIFRMLMVPLFVVCLMSDNTMGTNFALIIFIIASLTDFADGYIARKYNLITDFGKLLDPIADKLLVSAGLICFVQLGVLDSWIVIVLLGREFIMSAVRMLGVKNNVVIKASKWGKWKTVIQMALIFYLLFPWQSFSFDLQIVEIVKILLIYGSLFLSVYSLVRYLKDNRVLLYQIADI